jgi:hypothetical protein
MPLWQTCTLPKVRFTSNNRINSALSRADIGSLFDIFLRNARVLLIQRGDVARGQVYPVAELLRQTSTDFYKWYTLESRATTRKSLLRFELKDVNTNAKQTFLVDGGNMRCFQMLKQSIWDSFWSILYLNGAPPLFEISVSHLLTNLPDCSTSVPTSRDVQARSSTNTDAGPVPRVQFVETQLGKKLIYIMSLIRIYGKYPKCHLFDF